MMPSASPVAVLIAEDQPIFATGLTHVLEPEFVVTAVVNDGAAVPRLASATGADLILLDLSLPHLGGIPLVQAVARASPTARIVVLNGSFSEQMAEDCLHQGARGFVAKTVTGEELRAALGVVLDGRRCVMRGASHVDEREHARDPALSKLTHRERQVLALIAMGLGTRGIAQRLSIAPSTVESHRAAIRLKLGIQSGPALMRVAVAYAETGDAAEELAREGSRRRKR